MVDVKSVSETLTIKRCLPVRYSAEVMVTVPVGGMTVTEVASGGELTPAEFVATTCTEIVAAVPPIGTVGVKLSTQVVVDVVPLQVNGRVGSPETGPPVTADVSDQVTSTFSPPGSIPVATIDTGVPESTVIGEGGVYDTVGVVGAFTLMVADETTEAPHALTVSVAVAVAGPTGAVNTGVRGVAPAASVPMSTVQDGMAFVPPAVPLRVTVPLDET